MVISDTECSWRPVASSVPLGCILGLVLLIILIRDLDDGIECSVSQFADNTKLGGVADMPEGHSAIQGDHSKLEKWSNRKLMKFDKMSKSLHLRRSNPMHRCMPGGAHMENSFAEQGYFNIKQDSFQ